MIGFQRKILESGERPFIEARKVLGQGVQVGGFLVRTAFPFLVGTRVAIRVRYDRG